MSKFFNKKLIPYLSRETRGFSAKPFFGITVAQMRRRETPDQQVGYSNPDHLSSFLVDFLLHNFGSLIETVAALLVASVSKIKSEAVVEQM